MKQKIQFLGDVTLLTLDQVSGDSDFKSFMQAAKDKMDDGVKYLMFFKTEVVHEGVNGNGLRFFNADLKNANKPFLYAPVKWEHQGTIIGTVVSSRYKKEKGIGSIEVKGVLWTLEQTYAVKSILEELAWNPEAYKTSMECFYDDASTCDYGIGDKKISYNQYQKVADYRGQDYHGRGVVWQRANNPTFTGIAFTRNPADPKSDVAVAIPETDSKKYQYAYASIVNKDVSNESVTILCPHCESDITDALHSELAAMAKSQGKAELNSIDEVLSNFNANIRNLFAQKSKEEAMAKDGTEGAQVESVEELEEIIEEEIIEEEVVEETSIEEDTEAATDTNDTENDTSVDEDTTDNQEETTTENEETTETETTDTTDVAEETVTEEVVTGEDGKTRKKIIRRIVKRPVKKVSNTEREDKDKKAEELIQLLSDVFSAMKLK